MDISGKYIAILVHNYFEQAEFEEPLRALKDAGAEVTVISADKKELQGLNHIDKGDTFRADLLLAEASSDDYDALVLPGGVVNADNLRVVEAAQRWVLDFLDAGKPLAVICHAPWVLVSADAVEGRRLTSYRTLQDDISNAGGEWVNLPVVVDGNLITSRKPDDLPHFNDALIRLLSEPPTGAATPVAAHTPTDSEAITENDAKALEDDTRLRALGYDKQRDQLDADDEADILADEDERDPDELHPSSVITPEEQDGPRANP